jgi:hypothetical protein
VLAAVVVTALSTPVAFAAIKNDVFSDVPSTAADHDAINRVYNAGIMHPCATSPSLMFCPNQTTIRRGAARQYDYAFGLSGTPGTFTPTFQAVDVKTGGGGFATPEQDVNGVGTTFTVIGHLELPAGSYQLPGP